MRSIRRLFNADTAVLFVGVAMGLYHLASTQYLLFEPVLHENVHFAFALTLVFLSTIRNSRGRWWPLLFVLIALSIVATGYVQIHYEALEKRAFVNTPTDVAIGILLVILAIEACRQSFGPILPSVALMFIAYAFLGHHLPGAFHVGKLPLDQIIARFSIGGSDSGLYGGPTLFVSANYIFLFVLFGGLIKASGAIDFFLMVGKLVGRKLRSGPGMTAVVSSALVGSVTGSAVANVSITGAFTIPMMKRMGYRPEQAGGIEAAASSGGQIMPPVMGAAAFLMAELLGVPYVRIIVAAAIPAILYFLAVGMYVQFQAIRLDLQPSMERIEIKQLLWLAPTFVLPLLVIIILLVQLYSPMYAAFWAIVTLLLTKTITDLLGVQKRRPSLRAWARGFSDGALSGAAIAVASAVLGPIIATLLFTGLGIKMAALIETWSGGSILVALMLTMVVSILLGMGAPTLVAYAIVAIVICPVLARMGIPLQQAHFFAFFFAVFAALSPPVAMAALVGSGIAGANFLKTATESVKAGLAAFLLPYLIVWAPVLILKPANLLSGMMNLVASAIGLCALAAAVNGFYLKRLDPLIRILLFATGAAIFTYVYTQSYIFFLVGIGLFVSLTGWEWKGKRQSAKTKESGII